MLSRVSHVMCMRGGARVGIPSVARQGCVRYALCRNAVPGRSFTTNYALLDQISEWEERGKVGGTQRTRELASMVWPLWTARVPALPRGLGAAASEALVGWVVGRLSGRGWGAGSLRTDAAVGAAVLADRFWSDLNRLGAPKAPDARSPEQRAEDARLDALLDEPPEPCPARADLEAYVDGALLARIDEVMERVRAAGGRLRITSTDTRARLDGAWLHLGLPNRAVLESGGGTGAGSDVEARVGGLATADATAGTDNPVNALGPDPPPRRTLDPPPSELREEAPDGPVEERMRKYAGPLRVDASRAELPALWTALDRVPAVRTSAGLQPATRRARAAAAALQRQQQLATALGHTAPVRASVRAATPSTHASVDFTTLPKHVRAKGVTLRIAVIVESNQKLEFVRDDESLSNEHVVTEGPFTEKGSAKKSAAEGSAATLKEQKTRRDETIKYTTNGTTKDPITIKTTLGAEKKKDGKTSILNSEGTLNRHVFVLETHGAAAGARLTFGDFRLVDVNGLLEGNDPVSEELLVDQQVLDF